VQEIYKDVIDNALSAAFQDPRFPQLREEEMRDVEIEISVLTQPQKLAYASVDDLLNKLQPLRDGVIVEKGRYGATYLPQVWEDIASKEDFLSSLCEKAGLPADEWRGGQLKVLTYQAEVFGEGVSN
jgi:AmmeMemoRadiSam system protein A